ncbi:ribonuclease HI family protein [Thermotoga sp. KOL6]|uniref:ribonuclease HI family protein n=1 Tax=Thermotoga sp. KOL6 TaxID=126741 RepID=UPI000C758236|nr:ribonuclease HI family protein [Thermotoga sp. KOL6]PLV59831.1 hypothetical protein AS005_00575 [Thermotoga sp. KOL6]
MVFLYFDGSSKPNPGKMRIGFVILDENGNVLKRCSKTLAYGTNNMAEYLALLEGLEEVLRFGEKEVVVRGDSRLVIKQLKNEYKVKSENLKPIYEKVKNILKKFERVHLEWVSEKENKLAHDLANMEV